MSRVVEVVRRPICQRPDGDTDHEEEDQRQYENGAGFVLGGGRTGQPITGMPHLETVTFKVNAPDVMVVTACVFWFMVSVKVFVVVVVFLRTVSVPGLAGLDSDTADDVVALSIVGLPN